MACSDRYANVYQYVITTNCDKIVSGFDDSVGGVGKATVDDSTAHFLLDKIESGMPIYNPQTGVYGLITSVADTSLTTNITWDSGDEYRIATADHEVSSLIETYLTLAAGSINAARAAADMCSCTEASWATGYLQWLNIMLAAVTHKCPCADPDWSDDFRLGMMNQLSAILMSIRTGELELCQNETGADYPDVGTIERSVTPWAAARIIMNERQRNP